MGLALLLLGAPPACSAAILVSSFLGVRPLVASVTLLPALVVGCRALTVLP